MILTAAEGNTKDIATYHDFIKNTVQDQLERVECTSAVNLFGGVMRELQIIAAPLRLSRYNLMVPKVVRILRVKISRSLPGIWTRASSAMWCAPKGT
ncbi:MAG: hypothetical protein AAF214_05715 [Pseudomonadota bacterium]